jgi:hypothetical protein
MLTPHPLSPPQAKLLLLTGPGTLDAGGHRMPFLISMPAGLPASMAWHQGTTRASVTYKVHGLDRRGRSFLGYAEGRHPHSSIHHIHCMFGSARTC